MIDESEKPKEPDPTSYSSQEMYGQPPTSLRLGASRIHFITGVPPNTLGTDNDFAFRGDGAAGANTTIYHKQAGAWVGLTC